VWAEEGGPLSDKDGYRTDIMEAVKKLGVSILRYPGYARLCWCSVHRGFAGAARAPRRRPHLRPAGPAQVWWLRALPRLRECRAASSLSPLGVPAARVYAPNAQLGPGAIGQQ
jgi:hypothetical protein